MPKRFADLSPEEKQRRYDYNRQRRERIREAAIAGGYEPAQRETLSDEERERRQKDYRKSRNETIRAAYQRLREQGFSPAEANEELEESLEGVQYIQGPATYLGPDYQPGMFGSSRRRRR